MGDNLNFKEFKMVHEGNLIVSAGATLADLTSVSGSLYVRPGATLDAPQLTSVDRLYVHEGATLTAPLLTSVAGDLDVRDGATLIAPQLTSVAGGLYVCDSATLTAPLLTTAYGQPGREIARCSIHGYVLWFGDNGLYYAGCRRGLTRDAALVHWQRQYLQRSKLFTAAILNT